MKLLPIALLLTLTACSDDPPHLQATIAPGTGHQAALPGASAPASPITTEQELLLAVGAKLRAVKSHADAERARLELGALAKRAQPLIDKHKQVYAGTPEAVAAFAADTKARLAQGLTMLQAELARVGAIPGAREQLEEPMVKIMMLLAPQP